MRNLKRSIASLALAFTMVAGSLAVPQNVVAAEKSLDGQIIILHTNDVHGAISGYANVAALKEIYESQGAYVLLLDAGDYIQGDTTVSISQGQTAVNFMNMVGYDAVTLGNHEFDYGFENLQTVMADADFSVLASNLTVNGENPYESLKVFTAPDDTKIGVFGLMTPETSTKAHPAKLGGATFTSAEALYADAQECVDLLTVAGCDYIVALGHLGVDPESAPNRSVDVISHVDGIDLFIDGHSHTAIADEQAVLKEVAPKTSTVLTSTGTKAATVGKVTLDNGKINAENITIDETSAKDATIAKAADDIKAAIEAEYGQAFATTEVKLNGEKAPGNRTEETNLGDLICDSLVWAAKENGEAVDAAITNGGGIRATIEAGNISKKDVNTVLPFGNTASIIKIKGSELLEVLETSTYCTPTAIGGFPQVSGIEFTVNTTAAYDAGDLYPGTTYNAPKSVNRVTIQSIGGKAFDPEAIYTIVTNDFLAAGGDTYYAFKTAAANYDLGIPMDEVLMDYITTVLGGNVSAAQYGAPRGSIVIY